MLVIGLLVSPVLILFNPKKVIVHILIVSLIVCFCFRNEAQDGVGIRENVQPNNPIDNNPIIIESNPIHGLEQV
jgi:hypothetical protein